MSATTQCQVNGSCSLDGRCPFIQGCQALREAKRSSGWRKGGKK